MRIHLRLILSILAMIAFTNAAGAESVVRGDKEWLQPADFKAVSIGIEQGWPAVNLVCPAPTGVCIDGGMLNGIDVTGYTWASIDDFNELIMGYGGPGPLDRTVLDQVDEDRSTSTWYDAFLQDFTPTQPDNGNSVSHDAWLAKQSVSGSGDTGAVSYVSKRDTISTFVSNEIEELNSPGTWLWRPAPTSSTPVPTLPFYALLALGGLIGFLGLRKLKQ